MNISALYFKSVSFRSEILKMPWIIIFDLSLNISGHWRTCSGASQHTSRALCSCPVSWWRQDLMWSKECNHIQKHYKSREYWCREKSVQARGQFQERFYHKRSWKNRPDHKIIPDLYRLLPIRSSILPYLVFFLTREVLIGKYLRHEIVTNQLINTFFFTKWIPEYIAT